VGVTSIDLRFITRQGRRINRLVAGMESRPQLDVLKSVFAPDELRDISITRPDGSTVRCLHLRPLVDQKRLQTEVMGALSNSNQPLASILPQVLPVTSLVAAEKYLLHGHALLIANAEVWSMQLASSPRRSVEAPSTERAIFGAKDSLVEELDQNIALIRNHLRDPNLEVERLSVGTRAETDIAVVSLAGAVDAKLLDDVLARLRRYAPERLGFVSALLRPLFGVAWSPFLRADFSERPDRIADQLYRGRIVVLADGSPFALIVPQTLDDLFKDEESELQSVITQYFIRGLRLVAFFISVFLPGLYVAVLTVNTTILPGLLAISVAASRQPIAFPIFTETLMLLLIIDIMAEATASMKGVLGPAISIVGSLIIGQATVRANLSSNLAVILIAVTALSTYITPRYFITYAYRIWKYPILFLSGLLGILGWTIGVLFLVIHLAAIRTLGVNYLSPASPLLPRALGRESMFGFRLRPGAAQTFRRRQPGPA
jgi:hypothetical protein